MMVIAPNRIKRHRDKEAKQFLTSLWNKSVYRALQAYHRLQRNLEPGFENDQTPVTMEYY